MTEFQTSVRIARPIEAVFAYVSDPLRLPRWNSAVGSVTSASSPAGEVGSTYAMRRTLPNGEAHNEIEIVTLEPPTAFAIRTNSGPTPFVYRYRFIDPGAATVIEFSGEFELAGVAALAGPLAARVVKRGVDANLATLRQLLEQPAG
jgi:uncharacterized protein YndB with AHSA1/START domain